MVAVELAEATRLSLFGFDLIVACSREGGGGESASQKDDSGRSGRVEVHIVDVNYFLSFSDVAVRHGLLCGHLRTVCA